MRGLCDRATLLQNALELARGSRHPTTVASTMPPVLSLRHRPSIHRQAKGN